MDSVVVPWSCVPQLSGETSFFLVAFKKSKLNGEEGSIMQNIGLLGQNVGGHTKDTTDRKQPGIFAGRVEIIRKQTETEFRLWTSNNYIVAALHEYGHSKCTFC
jgi:hypothetical protein